MHTLGMSLVLHTCTVHSEGTLQGKGQRELALVAERASEIIHVKGPQHGTSQVILFKPFGLLEDRG